MAYFVFDASKSNVIHLPEELIKSLGVQNEVLVDAKIRDEELIISPPKIKHRVKITSKELTEAIEFMMAMMGEDSNNSLYESICDGARIFLKKLNIKVEG